MRKLPDFVSRLRGAWHLAFVEDVAREPVVAISCAVKLPDSLPCLLHNPRETEWSNFGGRVWVQTDCQQVAQVFCGLSVMKGSFMRPLCVRISRLLHRFWSLGVRPRTDWSAYIEWDAREFNALADDGANMALNGASDWRHMHEDNIFRARASNVNYRICFDGACRGPGDAAAGAVAIAYYKDGRREVLFRAGILLGKLHSAFLSELLALEWALDLFLPVIHNCKVSAGSGMKT